MRTGGGLRGTDVTVSSVPGARPAEVGDAGGPSLELGKISALSRRRCADGWISTSPRRGPRAFGENGAGKSTLINIVAGTFPPDSGSFRYQGKEIAQLSPHAARAIDQPSIPGVQPRSRPHGRAKPVSGRELTRAASSTARRCARAQTVVRDSASTSTRLPRSLTVARPPADGGDRQGIPDQSASSSSMSRRPR